MNKAAGRTCPPAMDVRASRGCSLPRTPKLGKAQPVDPVQPKHGEWCNHSPKPDLVRPNSQTERSSVSNCSSSGGGFYSCVFNLQELADLTNASAGPDLADELAVARIALRRIMEKMDEEIDFKEYAQYAGLIFAGTNSVARLMRAQRALSGESDESLSSAIAQALDELGKKWDVQL